MSRLEDNSPTYGASLQMFLQVVILITTSTLFDFFRSQKKYSSKYIGNTSRASYTEPCCLDI